jgi:predicted transcriptional regulator
LSVYLIDPKQLRRIRVQLNITQAELARASGVSQSLIAKLESGRVDPSFTTIKAITEALRSHIRSEGRKASEVMSSPVISLQSSAPLSECINLMRKNGISQLPVFSGTKLLGSISEGHIVSLLNGSENPKELLSRPVSRFLEPSFPIVNMGTPVEALYSLFNFVPAVLVASDEKIEGIITKIDLIASQV